VVAGAWHCRALWKSAHPRTALLIAMVVLAALYYYGHVQDRLLVRMHWLNAGLGLMQILPMRGILRSQLPGNRLERACACPFWCLPATPWCGPC
jgi:hypothetical protein